MTLEVGDEQFAVSQLGEDFLVLQSSRRLSPTSGTVVVDVGGQRVVHRVSLPNGIDPHSEDQVIIHLETVPLAKAG
jgi:hypothetical protein